ncbi:indole-3-glycerol phosphate synthase TrpC [Paenibacillus sp. GCM10027626]|uniref:indole-3-glycerol phosphate synthase TrpC n=1 Tax=Paenibacillus sp. GCM10027626 TaxID=3273411 RepID=UPI0036343A31
MFLDKIVATKRQEVAALAEHFSLDAYEKQIAGLAPCRGFERALTAGRKRRMGLIAEVKKASPSKGLIRADFHPLELAQTYQAAGADCISVLTDETYFQGSNQYLTAISGAVTVPLLRKDFIIDYRQVYEARIIGADAVLLIAAILSQSELAELYDIAKSIGLDVLVEVHDREEMERVLELNKATLVGINNRDLKTFSTDLNTTKALAALAPANVTVISESAIANPADVAFVEQAGAKGILVGEHFMRQPDVRLAVDQLLGQVAAQ